jgi:hypothetical protein
MSPAEPIEIGPKMSRLAKAWNEALLEALPLGRAPAMAAEESRRGIREPNMVAKPVEPERPAKSLCRLRISGGDCEDPSKRTWPYLHIPE